LGGVTESWWSESMQAQDLLFYVLPQYRGRLGIRLMQDFIGWAKGWDAVGLVFMGVNVGGPLSERAERLYQHMGLRRVGSSFAMRVGV